jgi:hypothetical protein
MQHRKERPFPHVRATPLLLSASTGTWLDTRQPPGDMVSPAKLGCRYPLLYVAFATVARVIRAPLLRHPLWRRPAPAR